MYNLFFLASPSIDTNDTVSDTIDSGQTKYINYPLDADTGVTIQLNVNSGIVMLYVSTSITTPNEAIYDAIIETDGYGDIYLGPTNFCNTDSQNTVYIAVMGGGDSDDVNDVSISVYNGDTSTG